MRQVADMVKLALSSLRHRTGAFVASFLSLFLGATIVMAFASLLDTGLGSDQASSTERETLVVMANVVGGWGLIIVVFAVASTLTLSVRQRRREMALLKTVGATPRQVRRMIVGEAAVVSIVAAGAAVVPAAGAGRLVFALLRDSDQVSSAVDYRFGAIALGIGFGVTFLAATIAALLTARRATGVRAQEAMVAAAVDNPRMSRKRKIAAGVFLALGLETGVLTATLMKGEGSDAMQTGGQAAIWFAIGLAILAPALVRASTRVVAGPLQRLGGASGYLAAENLRQRAQQMAGALMPIILFTAIASATITMQATENDASSAEGLVKNAEEKAIETLNFVVVGMIALFAAIMLINTLVAATTHRRQELGQQRLAGATPPQVLRMVGFETAVLAATGVLFGALASLVTVVPYSIARTDSAVPPTGLGIYAGVIAVAAALTLGASLGAARRAIRTPAVEAVAAA
jgi:ABC-type antimicrobial peptide transport system permease subunit